MPHQLAVAATTNSVGSILASLVYTVSLWSGPFLSRLVSRAIFYILRFIGRMAEVIGVASGLLTLAIFAFQSSVSLRQVVESFQSNKKIIRELKEELETLNGVLQSLQQAVAENSVHLSGLNLPLFRCGKACKDFEEVIIKCTAHSGGSRTSFRDWAKLKYMGDDITGFKDMLGGYKSTINIALADANLYVLRPDFLYSR